MIVDETFLTESCQDPHCHCGHHSINLLPIHQHQQEHSLTLMDSGRSETSTEETTAYRNVFRDICPAFVTTNRDHTHCKISDLDPDGIQIMAEVDLQQLPEAVNREILKNSKEIIFEERETSREGSPLLKSTNRRNFLKYPLLEEGRRSLNSSKRSLCHQKTGLKSLDEDKRSLDGSGRNLTGSRRYLLVPLDNRNVDSCNKEYFHVARHSGSKERLNAMRKNIYGKESKESLEIKMRRRVSSNDDTLMIEMEKSGKSPRMREILLSEPNRTSLSDPNLSPNDYGSTLKSEKSTVQMLPVSPLSDLSPESGFYEGNQWNSSPEYARKHLRLSYEPVISRNRRSYENAQLQDVNEALSRPDSDHSSVDSDGSKRCNANPQKMAVPYTSV